ncbi:hypothetical protein MKX03_018476, partial [Papaver bracteatum]
IDLRFGTSEEAKLIPTSVQLDSSSQIHTYRFQPIVAVLAIIPLTPKNISIRAYRLSLMGTTCSYLFSLYVVYGKPRAWNLQAVQLWLQSLLATKDFIYFIYCLTFVSSNLNMKFALIPVLCRSLEHVAKFLRHNFSHSSLYRWQRNIIQTFMYWQ